MIMDAPRTKLVLFPDKRLRQTCAPVAAIDHEVRGLIENLQSVLRTRHNGLGLSAPQIGVSLRVFVVSDPKESADIHAFVNPEVTLLGAMEGKTEGCLSFPGIFEHTRRAEGVSVSYLDQFSGERRVETFGGRIAWAIQHENEHLDGKLLIDYAARPERRRIERLLGKERP